MTSSDSDDSIEINVDLELQLSPCSSLMNDTLKDALDTILVQFVTDSIRHKNFFDKSAFINTSTKGQEQSLHAQDSVWSRMQGFFRVIYTKRSFGDPTGKSFVEIKENIKVRVTNIAFISSSNASDAEEFLSNAVTNLFQTKNTSDYLVREILSTSHTSAFFSAPRAIKIVSTNQNRFSGIRLSTVLGSAGAIIIILFSILLNLRLKRQKRGAESKLTACSPSIVPEIIDVSDAVSSIGSSSPASILIGPASGALPSSSQKRPSVRQAVQTGFPDRGGSVELEVFTVVVPAGYPEELGIAAVSGQDTLEVSEVLRDFPLHDVLQVGDRIIKVDGEDATHWREEEFVDYLIAKRRRNKDILIGRKIEEEDSYCDDEGTSYYGESKSYFTGGDNTDQHEEEDDEKDDDTYMYRL